MNHYPNSFTDDSNEVASFSLLKTSQDIEDLGVKEVQNLNFENFQKDGSVQPSNAQTCQSNCKHNDHVTDGGLLELANNKPCFETKREPTIPEIQGQTGLDLETQIHASSIPICNRDKDQIKSWCLIQNKVGSMMFIRSRKGSLVTFEILFKKMNRETKSRWH
ncbi:hypothetical protein VNO78_20165 [Psophocarpus tetragonolobus]|uniref:Uncharacterized protein n=1 Tax=Psophocarpus tetragonolobus TaxID=3891 RepID=A0AAN9S8W9_PSOTE